MTILHDILEKITQKHFATNTGTLIHNKLRHITITPKNHTGDQNLVSKIKQNQFLCHLFSSQSKTEVPIAGRINNRFISRRIDRLLVDNDAQKIIILDYKTDTNHNINHTKYTQQLNEYAQLLHAIYPTYNIEAYILWTNDFLLEKQPIKPL